ncbi:MAG: aminotransferase class I/II-fold pyridoxal phosphate-dependent enzyme [Fuerstiella sp.]
MTNSHPARMGHVPNLVTPPSAPPIFQTTAFDIPDLNVLAELHAGTADGHIYTRDSNPNHQALADSIASLEHAEAGAVFASGMGAIAAVALTLASSGDHLLVARSLYGITIKLMRRLEQQFGISVTYVDVRDPDAVAAGRRANTKFCLIESVSNPLLEVSDIPAICQTLGDVPLIVDSTFTTPELIRPLDHGAAVVVHSASKYLNGHGDVMLGVAAGGRSVMRSVRATSSVFGQNANPFECWLTQRGLRTLPLRMKQLTGTARDLAAFLNDHPQVRRVYHPSLPGHGTHAVAQKYYPQGTGGIVSFELHDGGKAAVSAFMQAAATIPFSATLADARTTLSHPATTSHGFMTRQDRLQIGITDELVRISVGLEPFEHLRQELDAALRGQAG